MNETLSKKSVTNMIKGKYQQLEAKKIQENPRHSLSMAIFLSLGTFTTIKTKLKSNPERHFSSHHKV